MSRNIKNASQIQKYCKVCHDAGKSESEYRSHFIRDSRDPNSTVMCPTLLALECRYCYKNGHTVKYCPSIKDKDKQQRRTESTIRHQNIPQLKPKGNPITHNDFTCLECDSDEDQVLNPILKPVLKPVLTKPREQFPALSNKIFQVQEVNRNYAEALNKEPVTLPESSSLGTRPAPWASRVQQIFSKTSWADEVDSDSETD
jgi:hypothetical protein